MKQKKTITRRVIEIIGIYLVFYFAQNLVFSVVYDLCVPSLTFSECYFHALLGNIYEVSSIYAVGVVSVFQNLLLTIAAAIMTGCIFQQLLNKRPKIELPLKLAIRRRNADKAVVLNVVAGNKGKGFLHNVKCTITCYYVWRDRQEISANVQSAAEMNGEYVRQTEAMVVQNFLRFAFEVADFPATFLDDYLSKREAAVDKDYILVTLSGYIDFMGELRPFQIVQSYHFKDIVIGDYIERRTEIQTNPFTGKEKKKILWNNVMNPVDISEEARQEIVTEIKAALDSKRVGV